ncbi:hypothetical protein HPULCUR_007811 [Helicostylum pulchrum]|uniref:Uncharacterized protein n=1 Tax=Helicostylum pulchrum TaxID=562976 RepID=A0ABP9Y5V1_9FUNG
MSLINPKLNRFVSHLTLCGIIGFMYHTNMVFEDINKDLEGLASTTISELFTLKQCMKNIQTECTNCDQKVKDMRGALVHAGRARSFADVDLAEMKKVCQALLNAIQVLVDTNQRVFDQGKSFDISLSKAEKRFKTGHALYTWKYRAMGGAMDTILTGSTLGLLVGVCTTHLLGMYCTSYSKSHIEIILRKLSVDTGEINYTACDSMDSMGEIANLLRDQFELACKNDRTKAESCIRVKKQVENMITDMYVLQNSLYAMKKKAQVNEGYIEKIMRMENVVDLLKL